MGSSAKKSLTPIISDVQFVYDAASTFLGAFGDAARAASHANPNLKSTWDFIGLSYGMAFVAWDALEESLTIEICNLATAAYPPGSPAVRIAFFDPKPSLVELLAREIGHYFRNVLYASRQSPL